MFPVEHWAIRETAPRHRHRMILGPVRPEHHISDRRPGSDPLVFQRPVNNVATAAEVDRHVIHRFIAAVGQQVRAPGFPAQDPWRRVLCGFRFGQGKCALVGLCRGFRGDRLSTRVPLGGTAPVSQPGPLRCTRGCRLSRAAIIDISAEVHPEDRKVSPRGDLKDLTGPARMACPRGIKPRDSNDRDAMADDRSRTTVSSNRLGE